MRFAKTVNSSELKQKLASLIVGLEADAQPVCVTRYGKPKAVLVRCEDYEALLEKLDDLKDILAMKEALASPGGEAITLEEYERQRAGQ